MKCLKVAGQLVVLCLCLQAESAFRDKREIENNMGGKTAIGKEGHDALRYLV
jgi:hypothetical protein